MEWADVTEEYASGLLNTDILLTAIAVENTTSVAASIPTDAVPAETGMTTERDGEISPSH